METTESKNSKSEQERTRNYSRAILRHRVRRILVRILAVLAVCGILYGLYHYIMNRTYHSLEMSRIVDHIPMDGASFINLGDGIVEYNTGNAAFTDSAGRVIWEQSYEMEQPMVSTAGTVIAICDYQGRNVYVMNTTGVLGHFVTSMDVRTLTAASNGDVLCIMDGQESDWIRIFTADGRERAYLVRNMGESGYPLTAVLSPDGNKICISNLLMDGAEVRTTLSFYDLEKGDPEQNYLVCSYDYQDEIVPFLRFIDAKTCIAVSDARLMFWDLSGEVPSLGLNSMFSKEAQGVFTGEARVAVLFMDETANEMYILDVYDTAGNKLSSIPFSLNYSAIELTGGSIYINTDRDCLIFREDGKLLLDGSFEKPILLLHPPYHGHGMCAITSKELDEIELH